MENHPASNALQQLRNNDLNQSNKPNYILIIKVVGLGSTRPMKNLGDRIRTALRRELTHPALGWITPNEGTSQFYYQRDDRSERDFLDAQKRHIAAAVTRVLDGLQLPPAGRVDWIIVKPLPYDDDHFDANFLNEMLYSNN